MHKGRSAGRTALGLAGEHVGVLVTACYVLRRLTQMQILNGQRRDGGGGAHHRSDDMTLSNYVEARTANQQPVANVA
eukprot:scaffold38321_cov35-Tisochrysis_lutea.AAC.1